MKYTEQEVETIAKSMYKAVKKALGTTVTTDSQDRARAKQGKDALDDLTDPNFVAEAKQKSPVKRTAQMEKSEKGIVKLRNFIKKRDK